MVGAKCRGGRYLVKCENCGKPYSSGVSCQDCGVLYRPILKLEGFCGIVRRTSEPINTNLRVPEKGLSEAQLENLAKAIVSLWN